MKDTSRESILWSSSQESNTIRLNSLSKVDVEKLAANRHLNLIERILQDVVSVEFINVSKEALHVRSSRFTNHKELCS